MIEGEIEIDSVERGRECREREIDHYNKIIIRQSGLALTSLHLIL